MVSALSILALAAGVAAHGTITGIVAPSGYYKGELFFLQKIIMAD